MKHEYHTVNHKTINGSFYSEHPKLDGPVKVFNVLHYLIAEYSTDTGLIEWQRTLPPWEKADVEKWLGEHYPVTVGA